MSDTRSPPVASSLPPGRRPWLPDGGRGGPAPGEAWRAPDTSTGQTSASPRESRRSGRTAAERTTIQEAFERRARPASLLRPQRNTGRKAAIGFALLVAGALGGLGIGLSLRPGAPAPEQQSAQRADTPPAVMPNAASTGPATPNANTLGPPKTALNMTGSDARPAPAAPTSVAPAPAAGAGVPDAETLRKSLAAEQARLDSLARARTAAEAQLAQLQEQMAQREQASQREILARREAALASLPSVTAPLPAPRPGRNAEPRGESAGPAAAAAPSGGGLPRVVLHHRAGSYSASEAAGAMASQVREAGFDLNETRAVTATPSQRVVRYFHAEDAPAAARLAGRLGRGWALQDFRSYEPLPTPGLLEVWLPDR